MDNAIGINVECDFNLWEAAWRWGNAFKLELTQHLVVLGHLTLTLQHLDANLQAEPSVSWFSRLLP